MQLHKMLFHVTLNLVWFLHAIKRSSKTFLSVAELATVSAKVSLHASPWYMSAHRLSKRPREEVGPCSLNHDLLYHILGLSCTCALWSPVLMEP